MTAPAPWGVACKTSSRARRGTACEGSGAAPASPGAGARRATRLGSLDSCMPEGGCRIGPPKMATSHEQSIEKDTGGLLHTDTRAMMRWLTPFMYNRMLTAEMSAPSWDRVKRLSDETNSAFINLNMMQRGAPWRAGIETSPTRLESRRSWFSARDTQQGRGLRVLRERTAGLERGRQVQARLRRETRSCKRCTS